MNESQETSLEQLESALRLAREKRAVLDGEITGLEASIRNLRDLCDRTPGSSGAYTMPVPRAILEYFRVNGPGPHPRKTMAREITEGGAWRSGWPNTVLSDLPEDDRERSISSAIASLRKKGRVEISQSGDVTLVTSR